uniref:Ubiquitin carboxyl-terminal hydrolase 50 n=1 Tax=Apteryx owenii TaxID=8824 RepID=A0A8B9P665_APTOW
MASQAPAAPDDLDVSVCLGNLRDSSKDSLDEMNHLYQGLTGLQNLGNTCYMNAILQCLCSMSPLVEYFLSGKYVTALCKGHQTTAFSYFTRKFDCVSPEVFQLVLGERYPAFTKRTQQDAQEFLICVLNELHEALKKVRSSSRRCQGSTTGARESRVTVSETSIITQLFEGQLSYDITCLECETTTDKPEIFTVLSLPIPSESACSLQDCLRCFFQQDTLTWNNQIHCSWCGTKQDAAVKANITKAPKIIIFHLKRFDRQGNYKKKLLTDICYPLSNLDLSPYSYPFFCRNSKYSLCAVVNHFGFLDGGHYTAFCKHSVTKSWYSFDDSQITAIPNSSVQTAAAYLLFYTCQAFSAPTKSR